MIAEPRTIARICEIFHIPFQHSIEQLRDVYLKVSSSCGYDNFIRQPGGARLESAAGEGGGGVSRVTFGKDRMSFAEENADTSLENFRRRLEAVVEVAAETLSIPVLVARNITQRAVVAAPGGKPASNFLAENFFQLGGGQMEPFGRPTQITGMRLQFPPPDPRAGIHQVQIGSYARDPRALYIEDVATFKVPVQSREPAKVVEELREVDDFVQQRVCGFLKQFSR